MVLGKAILVFLLGAAAAMGQTYDLRGRVLDKVGMQPVPGAAVGIPGGPSAITDTAGRFVLRGDHAGIQGPPLPKRSEPYFRGDGLHILAARAGQPARVEWMGLAGESVSVADHSLPRQGWNRLTVHPGEGRDFFGFARITTGGHSHVKRVLRLGGPSRLLWSGDVEGPAAETHHSRSAANAKIAAGFLEVSADRLMGKSIAFASDSADLGDIVLEYPPRRLDVGAPPIYGAQVLFDGSRGAAAAAAEMREKWMDWPRFTPSDIKFRIARDPAFPGDTNRVAMQSCCEAKWGMDDIQSRLAHGDAQIHVEWMAMGQYDEAENPDPGPKTLGQPGYVNSGVYVQSRYEIQIESQGVSDAEHTMASLVDDYAASTLAPDRPNGQWQAYDITFRTARYAPDGSTLENARISVWWNGVLVHDNREARAPATGISPEIHSGEELDPVLYGLKLQSEGRDVRFRNIWIRHLDIAEPQTGFGY